MYDGENFEIEDEDEDEEFEEEENYSWHDETNALMATENVVKADQIKVDGDLRTATPAEIAENIRRVEQGSSALLDNFVKNPSRENIDNYINNLVHLYQLRRLGGNSGGETLENGVKALNDALRANASNLHIDLSFTDIPKGVLQAHFQVSQQTGDKRRMLYENSSHLIGRPLDALGGDAIYNPELIRPSYAGPWSERSKN